MDKLRELRALGRLSVMIPLLLMDSKITSGSDLGSFSAIDEDEDGRAVEWRRIRSVGPI